MPHVRVILESLDAAYRMLDLATGGSSANPQFLQAAIDLRDAAMAVARNLPMTELDLTEIQERVVIFDAIVEAHRRHTAPMS